MTGLLEIAARNAGSVEPAGESVPIGRLSVLDIARANEPRGFLETVWEEKHRAIPFVGTAIEGRELWQVKQAADRVEAGSGSEEDYQRLLGFALESGRPSTFMGGVGGILTDMTGLFGELATVAGGASAVASRTALGGAVKGGIERALEKVAARGVMGRTASKLAQVAAQGALATAGTSHRAVVGALQRSLPEFGVGEDDAGELSMLMSATAEGFVESLPRAYADHAIEMATEFVGGVVPAVKALQGGVLRAWLGKPGRTVEQAMDVLRRAGWNGVVGEVVEERLADLGRATLLGEGTVADALAPGWRQIAQEVVAFSVVPGGAAALSKLERIAGGTELDAKPDQTGSPGIGPDDAVQAEPDRNRIETGSAADLSLEAPESAQAAPDAEQRRTVALETFRQQAGLERVLEPAEAPTPEESDIAAGMEARGTPLVFVDTEPGEPVGAYIQEADTLVLSRSLPQEDRRRAILRHELVHWARGRGADEAGRDGEAVFRDMLEAVRRLDPEGLDRAGRLWEGRAVAQAFMAPEALREEEGLATYVQELTPWLEQVARSPARLQRALDRVDRAEQGGVLRRVVEFVRSLLQRVPGVPALTAERELEEWLGSWPSELRGVDKARILRAVQRGMQEALTLPSAYRERDVAGTGDATVGAPDRDAQAAEAEPSPATLPVAEAKLAPAEPPPETESDLTRPGSVAADRWKRALLDRHKPLERLTEALRSVLPPGMQNVPTSFDVEAAERLRSGRTAHRLEREVIARHWEPVKAELKAKGEPEIKVEEAGEYLYAWAAPNRNRVMRERQQAAREAALEKAEGAERAKLEALYEQNPIPDNLSGMSDAEAKDIIERWKADPRYARVRRILGHVRKLNDERVGRLVEFGLLSAEEAEGWRAAHGERYMPLRGFEAVEGEDGDALAFFGLGRGTDIRGRESQKARGRTSRADNPLVWSFLQAQTSVVRAEKQEALNRLLRIARRFRVGKVSDAPPAKREMRDDGIWVDVPDLSWRENPLVVGVKVHGKQQLIELTEEWADVAAALKGTDMVALPRAMRPISAYTRWIAAASTRFNPAFIPFNGIRDALGVALTTGIEHTTADAHRVLREVPSAARALLTGGKGTPWEAIIEQYKASGAPISTLGLNEFRNEAGKLSSLFGGLPADGKIAALAKHGPRLARHLGRMSDAVENAARLVAFKQALDRGETLERAGLYAKGIATNFETKGEIGVALNGLYAFANAGIQGTRRVTRALRTPRGKKVAGTLIGANFLISALNRALSPDDENTGENLYDALPDYVKRANLVIVNPFKPGDFITIPMPFVYNAFSTAGQLAEAVVFGGKVTPGAAVGQFAKTVLDNYNFLGGSGESVEDYALHTLAPTIADPLVDLATNRDWAGRPIAPHKYNEVLPDAENYFRGVSPQYRAMAAWLQRMTGGGDGKAGAIDWSPETLEHLSESILGGLGKFATRLGKTVAAPLVPDWEVEFKDIPVARRLYSPRAAGVAARASAAYRAASYEIEAAHLHATTLQEKRLPVPVETRRIAGLRTALLAADRQIKKLRDQIHATSDLDRTKLLEERMFRLQGGVVRRFTAIEEANE